MKKIGQLFILLILLTSIPVFGQENFPNTLSYDKEVGSPKADINSLRFIVGHWKGEAFGGITEEIWTAPLGGSMMGAFKLVVDDQVNFYEIETITTINGSLILRLKHFHSNLKGWEEKDETVDFRLVKVLDDKIYFDDFTFEKISDDEINLYVVIENGEERNEVKFNYKRVKK
jgi:hypothetical protein